MFRGNHERATSDGGAPPDCPLNAQMRRAIQFIFRLKPVFHFQDVSYPPFGVEPVLIGAVVGLASLLARLCFLSLSATWKTEGFVVLLHAETKAWSLG
jgi:hypothetical protein